MNTTDPFKQLATDIHLASRSVEQRRRLLFCSFVYKNDRVLCSNHAEQTVIGPRCPAHKGKIGFGISHDPTKYWDEVMPVQTDQRFVGGAKSRFPYLRTSINPTVVTLGIEEQREA
jgi:hypothetical protein